MEEKNCYICKWYYDWFGVCFNGDSEYCADCPPYPERGCGCFKRKTEEKDEISG